MASIDHYAVLDLKPDAAPEEIKKAYRSMAVKTHPDRGGATHLFRMVQEAYETLSDPDKRAAYDRQNGVTPEPAYTEPEQEPAPYDEPAHEESAYEEPEAHEPGIPAEEPAGTPRGRRSGLWKAKVITIAVVIAGLAGYWLFQDIGLLKLTQPNSLYRLSIGNSVPAIVYFVLWGFGTLVASTASDGFTAVKVPFICNALAGFFALVTATGTFPVWTLALGTGLALTVAIALPIRARTGA